ncbi:hypothetical protein HKBW3S03_00700, partial [Candidatus Hakubella thermalkaliphila]
MSSTNDKSDFKGIAHAPRRTTSHENCVIFKGVSFMENVVDFHGNPPTPEQMEQALAELEGAVMA